MLQTALVKDFLLGTVGGKMQIESGVNNVRVADGGKNGEINGNYSKYYEGTIW